MPRVLLGFKEGPRGMELEKIKWVNGKIPSFEGNGP
jgi:hypothetical protein